MTEKIARCGFKCHLCPAFVENIHSPVDQVKGASAWSLYFSVNIPAGMMKCHGCMSNKDDGFAFPDMNCPVRPCATEKGLENCALCRDYICAKLKSRMDGYESARKRFQGEIPQDEFEKYIAPYDAQKTLGEIRKASGDGHKLP